MNVNKKAYSKPMGANHENVHASYQFTMYLCEDKPQIALVRLCVVKLFFVENKNFHVFDSHILLFIDLERGFPRHT